MNAKPRLLPKPGRSGRGHPGHQHCRAWYRYCAGRRRPGIGRPVRACRSAAMNRAVSITSCVVGPAAGRPGSSTQFSSVPKHLPDAYSAATASVPSSMERLKVDDNTPTKTASSANHWICAVEEKSKVSTSTSAKSCRSIRRRQGTVTVKPPTLCANEILNQPNIDTSASTCLSTKKPKLYGVPLITSDEFEGIVRETSPIRRSALDRIFDTEADKFAPVLLTASKQGSCITPAKPLYVSEIKAKSSVISGTFKSSTNSGCNTWRNMDHRQPTDAASVGQQDPLVEYRRRGQQFRKYAE